jgi:hypothetical protein
MDLYDNLNALRTRIFTQTLFYPLGVLATNRMVNTLLQKKRSNKKLMQKTIIHDFKDIFALDRRRFGAMYLGFLPYSLTLLMNEYFEKRLSDYEKHEDHDED